MNAFFASTKPEPVGSNLISLRVAVYRSVTFRNLCSLHFKKNDHNLRMNLTNSGTVCSMARN
jgi:hypothetical protein